jgi:hypothetical protein
VNRSITFLLLDIARKHIENTRRVVREIERESYRMQEREFVWEHPKAVWGNPWKGETAKLKRLWEKEKVRLAELLKAEKQLKKELKK